MVDMSTLKHAINPMMDPVHLAGTAIIDFNNSIIKSVGSDPTDAK
jgi:hypothetical protein